MVQLKKTFFQARLFSLLNEKLVAKKDSADRASKFEYSSVLPDNQWRVDMVREIIEARADELKIENFSEQELDDMMEYLCTS